MQDFYCFKTCDLTPPLYITEACNYKNKGKRSREKHKGKTNINIASCWITASHSTQNKFVFQSKVSSSLYEFFTVFCDAHKGFHVVNETEVDFFLEFPWFLYDPVNVDNLIFGSAAFSKPSLYIWKFLVHVLLKPSLKGFEHNLTSMWQPNYLIVWTFFGIALLWDWNGNWPFPVLWPLLSFPNLLSLWV